MFATQSLAHQFDIKHGNDCIDIKGTLVFSNGARRENNHYGTLFDPPADPYECTKIKLVYWEEKLKRVLDKFTELKQHLHWQASNSLRDGFGGPDISKLQELKVLQRDGQVLQAKVKGIRTELEALMPEDARRRQRANTENDVRNEEFLSKLNEIKL